MGSTSFHDVPYNAYTNGSSANQPLSMDAANDIAPPSGTAPLTTDPSFDILEWHPAYQSCQRYFLDHAQHEPATQALCALINIRLPFQWLDHPIPCSAPSTGTQHTPGTGSNFNFQLPGSSNPQLNSPNQSRASSDQRSRTFVSLVPYIRRLVITAFDKPPILHGLFGNDYAQGVLPHVDCERRNYLFAAKHGGWRSCKKQYDHGSGGGGDESVPFMKPLDEAQMDELTAAEKAWSSWLAMEDWMVGPRAPEETSAGSSQEAVSRGGVDTNSGAVDLTDGVGEGYRTH